MHCKLQSGQEKKFFKWNNTRFVPFVLARPVSTVWSRVRKIGPPSGSPSETCSFSPCRGLVIKTLVLSFCVCRSQRTTRHCQAVELVVESHPRRRACNPREGRVTRAMNAVLLATCNYVQIERAQRLTLSPVVESTANCSRTIVTRLPLSKPDDDFPFKCRLDAWIPVLGQRRLRAQRNFLVRFSINPPSH